MGTSKSTEMMYPSFKASSCIVSPLEYNCSTVAAGGSSETSFSSSQSYYEPIPVLHLSLLLSSLLFNLYIRVNDRVFPGLA